MAREYPEQTYYPSAKVRFIARLEEYGSKVLTAPKKTTPKLAGVKDDRATLDAVSQPDQRTGARSWLLRAKDGGTTGDATAQKGSSDNLTFAIEGVVPLKASWKRPGVRTATTLSLVMKWQDFPFDPRVFRSIALEYFLGTIAPEAYARGRAGESRVTERGREPLNLVPDTWRDSYGQERTNKRFQGWVDKAKMRINEEMGTVEMETVDNIRLLEKQVRPPKLVVGAKKPIDEAVAEYLSHFPQLEGLAIQYLPSDASESDIPRLETALAGSSFLPSLGPPASGGGATGGASETVLDYLTAVLGSVAHAMRMRGTTLVIQKMTNLFGSDLPTSRVDDPYRPRNLPSGLYRVRGFIVGKNTTEVEVERDFARKEPKNIEVRSYDPHRKNVVVARFPEKGDEQLVTAGPGDGKGDKGWTVIPITDGIRSKEVLKQIAQEVYNTTGKQELAVNVTTENLSSYGGGNNDPDLLDMDYGDAFEALVQKSQGDATFNALETILSASELSAQYIIGMGFDPGFARAYARAYNAAGFQREFKMRSMTTDWDIEDGVTIQVQGVNYVVARVDRPTDEIIR